MIFGQEVAVEEILNSPPPSPDYNPVRKNTASKSWKETAVPSYIWSYGCTSTAVAMLAGYYDRNGFPCIYNGNINGGAAPLFNSAWTQNNQQVWSSSSNSYVGMAVNYDNSISASKNGFDGRTTDGHVDDFWVAVNRSGDDPDPWTGSIPPHDFFSNGLICVADYLGTSQDKFGTSDGSTSYFTYASGDKYRSQNDPNFNPSTTREMTSGLKQLFEDGTSFSYTVSDVYTQLIHGYNGATNGFTYNDLMAEIDAERPVIAHFKSPTTNAGHSCIIFGYNASSNEVVFWETWTETRYELTWGNQLVGSNGDHYDLKAVTVLHVNDVKGENLSFECRLGDIIIGPFDYVTIKDPPPNTPGPPNGEIMPPNTTEFLLNQQLSFYAMFTSYYNNTYPTEWRWKLELYHANETYTLISATRPALQGYYDLWQPTAPSSIPDYDWNRNEDGTINGKITVETTDNNGYYNFDEKFIRVIYGCNTKILQNMTFIYDIILSDCNINIENVTIQNNCNVIFDYSEELNIIGDFEIELGSSVEIK